MALTRALLSAGRPGIWWQIRAGAGRQLVNMWPITERGPQTTPETRPSLSDRLLRAAASCVLRGFPKKKTIRQQSPFTQWLVRCVEESELLPRLSFFNLHTTTVCCWCDWWCRHRDGEGCVPVWALTTLFKTWLRAQACVFREKRTAEHHWSVAAGASDLWTLVRSEVDVQIKSRISGWHSNQRLLAFCSFQIHFQVFISDWSLFRCHSGSMAAGGLCQRMVFGVRPEWQPELAPFTEEGCEMWMKAQNA